MSDYLFVISGMRANGAERVMSLLVNKAASEGNRVSLILLQCPNIEYDLDKRVRVLFYNGNGRNRVQNIIRKVLFLRKSIITINPSVIISFLTTCNIYACIANIGIGKPLIVSERNSPNIDCKSKFKQIIRNICYLRASGLIFQTKDAQDCFSQQIKMKSIVIPNPVMGGLPMIDTRMSVNRIVALGRLTKQKNYPMLLSAFSIFIQEHSDYVLDIYGDGEDRELLLNIVEEYGLEKVVFFHGNQKDVHNKIKDARMYVLSSDYEGISNSLLEAMSMGLPCISTDCPCGGSRLLIQSGVNGLLVSVGDYHGLAKAMDTIASDSEIAYMFSKNARNVRTLYSEDRILFQYFSFIKDCMDNT